MVLVAATSLVHFLAWWIFTRNRKMLEGKEVDKVIPGVGEASVDVTGDLHVVTELDLGMPKKELIPSIPGALSIEVTGVAKLAGDPAAVALHFLGQAKIPGVQFLADQLAKLRAGSTDLHPAVAAAAAAEAAAAPKGA